MAAIRGTWDAINEGRSHLYGRAWEGSDGEKAVARVSADCLDTLEVNDPHLRDCQSVIDLSEAALNQGVDGDPVKALATVGPRVAASLSPLNAVRFLEGCFQAAEASAATPASRALAAAGRSLGAEWFLIPHDAPGAFVAMRDGMTALAKTLAQAPDGPAERVCAAVALATPEMPRQIDVDRLFVQAFAPHASDPAVASEAARLAALGADRAERKTFLTSLAPAQAAAGLGLGVPEAATPITLEDDVLQIGGISLPRRPETA